MEALIAYWPIVLPAAVAALEVFIGMLPNKLIPHKSFILKILTTINEK